MENLDFARLRYEGENHPYTGHPAARSSMPELYYLLLMTILTSAEANEAQWMHLYRVAKGARYAQDVRELLPSAHALTGERIVECIESIRRDDLTNAFLLDAMLLYLLREEENAKLLEYIAGLCALLDVAPPVITETIAVAKCIIEQDHTYFSLMTKTTILKASDSYFYLYQPDGEIICTLEDAENIKSDHVTVLCAATKDISIKLDTWKAKHITFFVCNFENTEFIATEKQTDFFGCVFHGKSESSPLATRLYLRGRSVLEHCIFTQITALKELIEGVNICIQDCQFSDCKISLSKLFFRPNCMLKLQDSTLTHSEFIDCMLTDADVPSSGDACSICVLEHSSLNKCSFSNCTFKSNKYYPSCTLMLIDAKNQSSVHDNLFLSCKTLLCPEIFDNTDYLLRLEHSTQKSNEFQDCVCSKLIVER